MAVGSSMIRVGESLKSIGTIYQALLVNIQERFIDSSNEKDFGSNETAIWNRMELLIELLLSYYHFYAEGYTLTHNVQQELERLTERAQKKAESFKREAKIDNMVLK